MASVDRFGKLVLGLLVLLWGMGKDCASQGANSGLLECLHPDVCDVSLASFNLVFNVSKHILLNWGADCARFKFRELRSKIC